MLFSNTTPQFGGCSLISAPKNPFSRKSSTLKLFNPLYGPRGKTHAFVSPFGQWENFWPFIEGRMCNLNQCERTSKEEIPRVVVPVFGNMALNHIESLKSRPYGVCEPLNFADEVQLANRKSDTSYSHYSLQIYLPYL